MLIYLNYELLEPPSFFSISLFSAQVSKWECLAQRQLLLSATCSRSNDQNTAPKVPGFCPP